MKQTEVWYIKDFHERSNVPGKSGLTQCLKDNKTNYSNNCNIYFLNNSKKKKKIISKDGKLLRKELPS